MQPSMQRSLMSPGVYLQELAPTRDQALVTGIPVFLGVGKTSQITPKPLTLWTQFEQYFGAPHEDSYLSHVVRGFFESGGHCCYVIALGNHSHEALLTGLQIAESLDLIDLVCAPDIMQNPPNLAIEMQALVLEHCDRMGDRFAILDAFNRAEGSLVTAIETQRQRLVGDSGALYVPWLKVESSRDWIPPCGHVAGVYALCDREVGSHRAPANYRLEAALDLSATLSDQDWHTLNPPVGAGVNCIASFRGRGIRVWGARTLSQNPDWHYVNIRRLKITLVRWAERHLVDVVFEPNNTDIWSRLERELTIHCETLWEQGAIQGDIPEAAFYVKCDEETNPPEVRDVGQVVVEIGLAPTTPSEFIVLSLIHGSSGVRLIQS